MSRKPFEYLIHKVNDDAIKMRHTETPLYSVSFVSF